MTDSTQFAAQIGHMFGQSILQGIWMALVILWGTFMAAWPAFLIFGVVAYASYRLR